MARIETLFLDFDGTLAHRVGGWTNTLVEMVTSAGHPIDRDTLSPHMHQGFPWHRYELGHNRLLDGGGWWEYVLRVLETALIAAGVPAAVAVEVVRVFADRYLEPSAFSIYDDTRPALEQMRLLGYRCFIASNHTPELPDIVEQIGLRAHVDGVFSSALVGYDKPHHGFYRAVLDGAGADVESSVMIGDNFIADVTGARACGMSGIHVRAPQANEHLWHAETLLQTVDMLSAMTEEPVGLTIRWHVSEGADDGSAPAKRSLSVPPPPSKFDLRPSLGGNDEEISLLSGFQCP